MSRDVDGKYVNVNSEVIKTKIKACGITMDKLSTMVLGCDSSYVSKSLNAGRFHIDKLTKLCEFLNIDVDAIIIEVNVNREVVGTSESLAAPQLETMIVGLNTIYETQRKMCEFMEQMLTEIKCTNAKQNRLENALGQIVQNTLILKETTNKISDKNNEIKSQMNLISGRTKDIVNVFQKGGN